MAELSAYCHPSLGLGNIAQPEVVDLLDAIRSYEAQTEAAHDRLEAAIGFRRSLSMTLNELSDMGVDTESVAGKIDEADRAVSEAAADYVATKLENEGAIGALKKTLGGIPATLMPESPLDLQASELSSLPLASESLKLTSRYFSFNGNLQEDKLASIEKFVRSSTDNVGARSGELSRSVCDQITDQVENHEVSGTLIITVSCTHRNVHLFAAPVIDPDKAVNAWNLLKADPIDTSDPRHVHEALAAPSDDFLPLVTGAVYGSSFIGMVHFLQSQADTMGNLDELKARLDKKLLTGGWLAHASGGMGVDHAMMDEVRAFLSTNSVSCHVSIVATGAIPTIKSNELKTSCSMLARPEKVKLPPPADTASVKSEAEEARQHALVNSIRNARIGSILSGMSKCDDEKNSILDMKTLVNALDNYIQAIGRKNETVGVPTSFFIHRLTKAEIAKLWLKRYAPDPEAK